MEIEVAVLLDGQPIKANSDLQNLLQSLVNSYIKQSVSGKADKKVKVPKVKDPNAPKREPRAKVTEEEIASIIAKAKALAPTHTLGKVTTILSEEMQRSPNTIYLRLRDMSRKGEIVFQESNYNAKKN